jgi:ABC-2 type transport system permease protein|tara:strand:- start:474 stop:1565 length:1092 start_codon:yes stop_codon:yes gene_type:complete
MPTKLQLHLAKIFLKIFLRDRQSIFFSLFFPIIFMTIFAFANNGEVDPIKLGIVNNSTSEVASDFSQMLNDNPLFTVTEGEESNLRTELIEGDQTMVLILPEDFDAQNDGAELQLLVDAAQVQQLGLIMPLLEQTLISIEREFRNIEPMFTLTIEDVQARSQRYLDFLLPGLMAFTLMQLSIAGSGFNIVEFRRKGILKRLFVTPIKPHDFITAIVLARMAIILIQLTVLILFAVTILDVRIVGNFASFYLMIILGTFIFLCLGFCLGSIAKTQQAVMAVGNLVIFPQIFLSGVFYPIESMPELIQPIANLLPLSFVSTAMREIANNGASLLEITPTLIGIAAWFVIAFVLATRLFVWKEVAN